MKNVKLSILSFSICSAMLLALAVPGFADDADQNEDSATSVLLEEVIVTARKREESAQDVPISVTALGAGQLESLKIRNLENLSVSMPNVAMDDIGTTPGTANFSIRGLGINSSIPSIDPTVGVFVDGVFIGQNTGIVVDMFDIQSIEVLRGPQGTLFGRNVTGGAILINTKRPTDEFSFSVRAAIDGNPNGDGGSNSYAMGSISGPLGPTMSARLSFYRNNDDGWFTNLADGKDFGRKDTTIIRPVLSFYTDKVRSFIRYEHLETNGDGPASQSHTNGIGVPAFFGNQKRDSFRFAIDDRGFYDIKNDFITWESNFDVRFGDGTITNIFGFRDYKSSGDSDIDATPAWLFHAMFWSNAQQYSDELRFNGTFGPANVTTGIFWFTNEVNYHERRNLLGIATGGVRPALTQDGGGNYFVDSLAWFGAVDYDINDALTLNAGVRFTHERKRANIASLIRNINRTCNVVTTKDCSFDFNNRHTWDTWSGKLGATYAISDQQRIYGDWARSYRSGGYNLRNTAIDTVNFGPGPFGKETVDNFEIGYKSELGRRGRLNISLFYMRINDMQREINLSDPFSGVVQVIRNTADAEIPGFEAEGTFALGGNTVLLASVGYTNPSYRKVRFDLNGDGVLDKKDKNLDLPRAADWTYSIGLTHDTPVGNAGGLTARVNFAHRDRSAYTDNNLGFLLAQDILDAGLDFRPGDGHWVFSLYGRNLLDQVNHGGDTQLPTFLGPVPAGGTFSPLKKGQVVGFEVTYGN